METDTFFYQLFKHIPQTVFELIHQPAELARSYRFDSVEVKKSFRIDGLLRPTIKDLPLYIVEVQFQKLPTFYCNLFAKVFCFLEENDPEQDWSAVAVFANRDVEPRNLTPYEVLLTSRHVHRIYLEDLSIPENPSLGLGILQLVSAPRREIRHLLERLHEQADRLTGDSELRRRVIELTEELLIRRFTQYDREEIRKMFQLHDIRESKVWQEAREEGIEEGLEMGIEKGIKKGIEKGIEEGKMLAREEMIRKCLGRGIPAKNIAELVGVPIKEVRRLAKGTAK